ncbi:CobD/CbiB family protein [Derxia gummosa]|uniref:Cobalamin biosynthesis protein CobD n=1 Tax=Derxia gummosa DSM 723 TaxID=1121388 RepID=A0A8B6X257_9BURK|nr:CobD/CbiB family protein [Derxia gummosa]
MTFLSVVIALIIEQFRPLRSDNLVHGAVRAVVRWIEQSMNAGDRRHGVIGWVVLVLLFALVTGFLYWLVWLAGPVPLLLFQVLVLYLTLGFRQFSHPFSRIQAALEAGQLDEARAVLTDWKRETDPEFSAERLSAGEVARAALLRALTLVHRHVFGVFVWYVLAGPVGAVLYRVTESAARIWHRPDTARFGEFARAAFAVIDWLPVRLTALGFAIVGNFEDAMYAWRTGAARWGDESGAIVLAAGGGAMGLTLAGGAEHPVVLESSGAADASEADVGLKRTVRAEHLKAAVGLVWRAMVLWLVLLLLFSIAMWVA